jgi:hypothetical protein
MLFPNNIIDELVNSTFWADRMIRSELMQGLIAGENDYTSNLTGMLRRQINARAILGLRAIPYVLKPVAERSMGVDACIILSNTKEFKVCVFEAKFPQLKTHKNCWDSIQKATGYSHFHEQLKKQSSFSGLFAIWEMFYVEFEFGLQPPFMPNFVSACAWHDDALKISLSRNNHASPWTDSDLELLLSNHRTQIDTIIREVCECKKGKVFSGQNYEKVFSDFQVPQEVLVIEYTREG